MSQQTNLEIFHLCCGKVFSRLYEHFPMPVDLNVNLEIETDDKRTSPEQEAKDDSFIYDNRKINVGRQTAIWLKLEEHIQSIPPTPNVRNRIEILLKGASLPHKTFHVLSKKVDLYTTDGNQKLAVWLKQALEEEDSQKIETTVESILAELIKKN